MMSGRIGKLLHTLVLGPWTQLWRNKTFTLSLIRREIEGRYRGAYGCLLW